MTEQMPAKIWAISNFGVELWSKQKMPIYDSEQYIRADLAERMAEALARCAEARMPGEARRIARESISAFRSATQDTEARHD